jgi:hypothetical protein
MNLVLFFFNKGISYPENTKAAFAAAFIIIKYFIYLKRWKNKLKHWECQDFFPLSLSLPLPLPFPLPLPLPFPFKLPAFFVTCRRLPPTCI